MGQHLLAGVHGVAIESDLVVCDLVRDIFLLLPAAIAAPPTLAVPVGDLGLSPDGVAALQRAGLVSGDARPARRRSRPPVRQTRVTALDVDPLGLRLHHGLAFAAAGIEAALRLAFRRLGTRHQPPLQAAPANLANELAVLRGLMLACPGIRRCLPRALLTRAYLRRRGIALELVLGVRTHPFGAHCWLQSGDLLVDDQLDHVRGYKPVAVL